jgi:L-alanine-DL-glutamate epimerase-like enolase superfamily enzyme
MRIVGGKVIVCSPGRNFVTVKLETEDGIYGLGDATLNGRELAVASYLSDHLILCSSAAMRVASKTSGNSSTRVRTGEEDRSR